MRMAHLAAPTTARPGWSLPTLDGPARQAVSDAAVADMKRASGKGPTKVKTVADDRQVAVVMRDCLTTAHRSLIASGHDDLVRCEREQLHRLVAPRIATLVEALTGRRLVAVEVEVCVSDDVEVARFKLEPAGHPRGVVAEAGD